MYYALCLFDAVQIVHDALTGAYLCAGAAAGALCLVYLGYAALHVYGVVGAFFGAAAAGDTGLHAGCPGFAPAVGIAAGDDHAQRLYGEDTDDTWCGFAECGGCECSRVLGIVKKRNRLSAVSFFYKKSKK